MPTFKKWMVVALLLTILLITVYMVVSSSPGDDVTASYEAALAATAGHTVFERGSPEEVQAIEGFKGVFATFTPDALRQRVASTYAEELYFNDTLKTLRERDALADYLAESAEAVSSTSVDFQDVATSAGGYYFRWVMEIRFKKLAGGRPTRSFGISHVRFAADGRVILHQDHWDSTAGLWEHVPVVGRLIRVIRRRL